MNEQVNYAKIQRIQDNLEALTIGTFGTGFVTDAMLYESGIKATVAQHSTDLADMSTEISTKRTHLDTVSSDTVIPFEIHNQAGQNGVDVSSEVTHHYTDATAKVIDNVGDGTILMLSNSQNTVMRPDKAADYVGTGNVFKYRKFNNTLQAYEDILIIDSKGNITRQKIDEALNFICSKANNGYPAFTFDSTTAQTIPFNFRNGGSLLTINDESTFTKVCIVSAAAKTTGMEVRADAGDLYLRATSGAVKVYTSSNYYTVHTAINGTTANRPTGVLVGSTYFDATLGKPIWYKGSSVWVDATGTTV